jgi:xylulokinase
VPTVLGVDSSTQACKVDVRDADSGARLATGRAPHPPTTPPRSEQDPERWWQALVEAVRATGVRDVDAIAIAGQQHGMVALDHSGAPLHPAKLWNDTESAPDAVWLLEQLGGAEAWASACGSVPVASFTITKLSWLHRRCPDAWSRLAKVVLPHDYLNHRITGEHFTDRGDASGTGYWSPREAAYRFDLLSIVDDSVDWRQIVPPVVASDAPAARLSDQAADALGLRTRPVVTSGTGDNMAGALGIGLTTEDVAISLGTSGTVFTVDHRPSADPTGAVAGFAHADGRFLPLVCTLNATLVTQAVAGLLGVSLAELDDLALSCAPGADGLTLVPYLAGERTPDRPDATGTLAGIRTDVSRAAVARAAFEGVVCGLLDGLDALEQVTTDAHDGRVLLVGGGARSAAYRQVLADLTGRPVVVPRGDEHVATGACVHAAAVLRGATPAEVSAAWLVDAPDEVTPDPGVDHAAIRAAYHRAARRPADE